MKFTRTASATWNGSGKEGQGTVSTESTILDKTQYSFKTRFENGKGTNPEELIGAAHSGCFTMQLSFLLDEAGYSEKELTTEAKVTFEDGAITVINLELVGQIEGIANEKFQEIAHKAKDMCPISKLFNTTIHLSATLN